MYSKALHSHICVQPNDPDDTEYVNIAYFYRRGTRSMAYKKTFGTRNPNLVHLWTDFIPIFISFYSKIHNPKVIFLATITSDAWAISITHYILLPFLHFEWPCSRCRFVRYVSNHQCVNYFWEYTDLVRIASRIQVHKLKGFVDCLVQNIVKYWYFDVPLPPFH